MAQEAGPTISGNVALTTDYHWRNVSQSNQDMAIQGGFDLDTGMGIYAGAWASSIDFDNTSDSNVELDLYGGYAFEVAGVGLDVGFIYYAYPDSEDDDINFYEVYGAVSKEFGPVGIGGSLYWDPDNETIYGDIGVSYAVMDSLAVDASYGTYLDDADIGLDLYTGFNVGATYSVGGVDLDFRYYMNEGDYANDELEDNFVFSIAKSL